MEPSLKVAGGSAEPTPEMHTGSRISGNLMNNDNISTTSSDTTTTTTSNIINGSSNNVNLLLVPKITLEPYPHVSGKYPIHEAVYNNDMKTLVDLLGEVETSDLINGAADEAMNKDEDKDDDRDDDDDDTPSEAGKVTVNDRDSLGRTPLMYANKLESVKYMLAKNARVNLRDQERQTAMHRAAINGLTEVLSQLLDSGAHIKRDSAGCTPLHLSCSIGSVSCATSMIEKGPRRVKAEARDKRGKTALHYSIESSSSDDVSVQIVMALVNGGSMLDAKDREKKTPLHWASIHGKMKCITVLLEKGANVDVADCFGATPLHYVVGNQNCHKAVKIMVSKGAKVNAVDNTGQSPIFYASRHGHPKNVKALLRAGALANVKDCLNKTPLHFSLEIANPTISSMLVSGGADVTLRYKYGLKGEYAGGHKPKLRTDILDEPPEEGTIADIYGFLPDVSMTPAQIKKWSESKEYYNQLIRQKSTTEKLREKKWLKITENWGKYTANTKKMAKIQSLSWKSVPDSVRGKLWRLILQPNVHRDNAKVSYDQILNGDSEFVKQIDLDIDRTYRNHIFFRERFSVGQQSLFNVLKAYSIYDQDVGYCQGMSGFASILLMYMTEEEAFWSLVALMESEKYELRGLFLPSFPLLYRHYAIHESLLHDELPKIQSHFGIEGVTTSMYATKWFLTVFSGNVPFPLMIRFWDLLLIHGYYVIHTLVIHILRINQDTLIKEGFEKILSVFSNLDSNGIDIYSFCKGARKYKISEKKVSKLLKKHDLQQQLQIHPSGLAVNP